MNAKRVSAAAGVILAAQKQRQTPAGIAAALEAAGLLQSPESAAEWAQLQDDITGACLARHEEEQENARLRARVAELEAQANCPSQMTISIGTSRCALPVRHGGDHRNAEKNHHWSDEYADAARVRPVEDPHDGPLSHRYELGRDLPELGGSR